MRFLGLDVGRKRIGVALSDELGITAQGLLSFERATLKKDLKKLEEIIRQYRVEKIVIGIPKNMDGTLGKSAEEVLTFVESIKKKSSPIPIVLWDERFSTVAVNRALLSANVSRRRRKEVVDKLAAVYILQGFLDNRRIN